MLRPAFVSLLLVSAAPLFAQDLGSPTGRTPYDGYLGPMRSVTIGATYGFSVSNYPGEWGLRAEYMRQWGDGSPTEAPGVQKQYNQFPSLNVGTLLVTYSVGF